MSSTSSRRFGAEVLEHRVVETPSRRRVHAEARGQRVPHRLGIAHRRELAQPRAVGKLGQQLGRDLDREARSCRRRRPRQRHQRPFAQEAGQVRDVVVAPHERRHLARQVAGQRVQRAQRREVGREIGVRELEHMHRRAEIAKPMFTEIDQAHLGGMPSPRDRRRSRPRTAPARRGRPPSAARTGSAAGPSSRPARADALVGVQAHPRRNGPVVGPRLGARRRCASSTPATASGAEPNAAAIPSPIVENTTRRGPRSTTQDRVMARQRDPHRIRDGPPTAASNPRYR